MKWRWLLLALPFGLVLVLLVQMWRVIRSEEFRRDLARLREQRARARAARRWPV
jgi:hypothetical protein